MIHYKGFQGIRFSVWVKLTGLGDLTTLQTSIQKHQIFASSIIYSWISSLYCNTCVKYIVLLTMFQPQDAQVFYVYYILSNVGGVTQVADMAR